MHRGAPGTWRTAPGPRLGAPEVASGGKKCVLGGQPNTLGWWLGGAPRPHVDLGRWPAGFGGCVGGSPSASPGAMLGSSFRQCCTPRSRHIAPSSRHSNKSGLWPGGGLGRSGRWFGGPGQRPRGKLSLPTGLGLRVGHLGAGPSGALSNGFGVSSARLEAGNCISAGQRGSLSAVQFSPSTGPAGFAMHGCGDALGGPGRRLGTLGRQLGRVPTSPARLGARPDSLWRRPGHASMPPTDLGTRRTGIGGHLGSVPCTGTSSGHSASLRTTSGGHGRFSRRVSRRITRGTTTCTRPLVVGRNAAGSSSSAVEAPLGARPPRNRESTSLACKGAVREFAGGSGTTPGGERTSSGTPSTCAGTIRQRGDVPV
mmetsp:Transcript_41622/g.109771  ORF Transcript_41622/g.109771 Transcript_41622/m.109771 type:complete len:370 (+) Transcript_41622:826-1935(+)